MVENQTRARSSVLAKQGRGNGVRHLLHLADQHKERQTRHSHWDTAGSRYFDFFRDYVISDAKLTQKMVSQNGLHSYRLDKET